MWANAQLGSVPVMAPAIKHIYYFYNQLVVMASLAAAAAAVEAKCHN